MLVLWISSLCGIMASLAFVAAREKNVRIAKIDVSVSNNEENLFITESEVVDMFTRPENKLIGRRAEGIDLKTLEERLKNHPAIARAEVSHDPVGVLRMEVVQRKPMLRIINKDGESYYIDEAGRLMPLNENYTARVLVASGEIFEPYARRYTSSVDQISKSAIYSQLSLLDDLMLLTKAITADSLLTALIHQVYVNRDREIELFPSVGEHKIIFGDAANIDDKFRKLKLFYTEGLNKSDSWKKYSQINLKYKNLVVCTKKQTI
jgi:cell division protein FtsQ